MLQLPWIWFVIAGVTILAEIFTGTFYFLFVAFGFLVAGILGVFGIPFYIQLLVCTLIILFSLLILRQYIVA